VIAARSSHIFVNLTSPAQYLSMCPFKIDDYISFLVVSVLSYMTYDVI